MTASVPNTAHVQARAPTMSRRKIILEGGIFHEASAEPTQSFDKRNTSRKLSHGGQYAFARMPHCVRKDAGLRHRSADQARRRDPEILCCHRVDRKRSLAAV